MTAALQLSVAVLASVLLAGLMLAAGSRPSIVGMADLVLGSVVIAVMACAHRYPVEGDARGRATLDAGGIFFAVLLFDPGIALLLVVAGVLVGHTVSWLVPAHGESDYPPPRPSTYAAAIGQAALQATAGGLLLVAGGWTPGVAQ